MIIKTFTKFFLILIGFLLSACTHEINIAEKIAREETKEEKIAREETKEEKIARERRERFINYLDDYRINSLKRRLRAKDRAIRNCRANTKPDPESPKFLRVVDAIFSPKCIDEGQAVFDAMQAEDERMEKIFILNNIDKIYD